MSQLSKLGQPSCSRLVDKHDRIAIHSTSCEQEVIFGVHSSKMHALLPSVDAELMVVGTELLESSSHASRQSAASTTASTSIDERLS